MTRHLLTAEDGYPVGHHRNPAEHRRWQQMTPIERCVARYWGGTDPDGWGKTFKEKGFPEKCASGPVLQPFVRHGRWVVRCPACPSAMLASRADGRFLCCNCGNVMDGGLWLPVEFPAETAHVEAALLRRPVRQTRNWKPPETPADLIDENRAHGIV